MVHQPGSRQLPLLRSSTTFRSALLRLWTSSGITSTTICTVPAPSATRISLWLNLTGKPTEQWQPTWHCTSYTSKKGTTGGLELGDTQFVIYHLRLDLALSSNLLCIILIGYSYQQSARAIYSWSPTSCMCRHECNTHVLRPQSEL